MRTVTWINNDFQILWTINYSRSKLKTFIKEIFLQVNDHFNEGSIDTDAQYQVANVWLETIVYKFLVETIKGCIKKGHNPMKEIKKFLKDQEASHFKETKNCFKRIDPENHPGQGTSNECSQFQRSYFIVFELLLLPHIWSF